MGVLRTCLPAIYLAAGFSDTTSVHAHELAPLKAEVYLTSELHVCSEQGLCDGLALDAVDESFSAWLVSATHPANRPKQQDCT